MASYTTNLNLKKPAGSENVAIGDINNNMDTIDQAYGTLNSKLTNISDTVTPIANYFGSIGSTDDFNSFTTSGVYNSLGTNNNQNKPAGVNDNGFLIVFRISSTAIIQLWIGTYTGNIVYRKYNGSFGNWKTISAS